MISLLHKIIEDAPSLLLTVALNNRLLEKLKCSHRSMFTLLSEGPIASGVTEAGGALRDFFSLGPQLRAYVKWYDRHGK